MLGICVIYLFPDADSVRFLDLSLSQFRRLTRGKYRIFACGARLSPEHRQMVAERDVELLDLPPAELPGAFEHAWLLDHLVDAAFAAGCDRVATFDLDSWPVAADWDTACAGLLTVERPVVAMVRSELDDNFPCASFTMMDRSFWQVGKSSFSLTQRRRFDPAISGRLARTRETGTGIYAQLAEEGRGFHRLHRTNHWLPHPIMGAVYGGVVFHFGGGSRVPHFITDHAQYRLDGSRLRYDYMLHMNGAARRFFVDMLESAPDEFILALSPLMGLEGLRAGDDGVVTLVIPANGTNGAGPAYWVDSYTTFCRSARIRVLFAPVAGSRAVVRSASASSAILDAFNWGHTPENGPAGVDIDMLLRRDEAPTDLGITVDLGEHGTVRLGWEDVRRREGKRARTGSLFARLKVQVVAWTKTAVGAARS